jgi:general secretion pathway protein A
LTGEPGIGKTTVRQALEAEARPGEHWLKVEISPGSTLAGFYALIGHEFGLDHASFGRIELSEFLAERRLASERWFLAIEEAQNLDVSLLEEVRLLSNSLGRAGGFAGILLIGQTALARRLVRRSAQPLASRIVEHVHLRPLDADEVGLLLKQHQPSHNWSVDLIERIQVLSEGRPGNVLRLASFVAPRAIAVAKPAEPAIAPKIAPAPAADYRSESLIGPTKPPIRVEEGLIEVGWDPADDTDLEMNESDEPMPVDVRNYSFQAEDDENPEGEERINDHYAALQAWQEWAANQGRSPEPAQDTPGTHELTPITAEQASVLDSNPNVWVDEEQGFAPLGRLFNRLKQENESE